MDLAALVKKCEHAFHSGAVYAQMLQARHGQEGAVQPSAREMFLLEMLHESMTEGEEALANHFEDEQVKLEPYDHLMRQGDAAAREEFFVIAMTLQERILETREQEREVGKSNADLLKALHETAIAKRHDAIRAITDLHQRVASKLEHDRTPSGSVHSRQQSIATITGPRNREPEVAPEVDDVESVQSSDDDRFTIAREAPYIPLASSSASQNAPQALYPNRYSFSSAASIRAAEAPEVVPSNRGRLVNRTFRQPEVRPEYNVPVSPIQPRRDRPSVPESHVPRSDSMPWASRILTNASAPTRGSSPRISEPDSAISFKMHNTSPICAGAVGAQENFQAAFTQMYLPLLPDSNKQEICWKCKACDFNASNSDEQLFERIAFKNGVRYRWMLLAKSHVPYQHKKGDIRSSFMYGCVFCTAEGKTSFTYSSTDDLMEHIHAKHETNLTPEVKARTKCIIGKLADRNEDWDVNFAEITKKAGFKKFMIHAITALPT